MQLAIVVAMIEVLLVLSVTAQRRHYPLTGGPLAIYRASVVCAGLSVACITAAALLTFPQLRGVAAVIAAAALAVAGWRTVQRRGRQTLTAEAGWTMAPPPPATPTPAPAVSQWESATIRNIEAMQVQP